MPPEELAKMEYEALQAEKRDKMQGRLQIWSLLIALIGAFGIVSVQPGASSYVIVLYPVLAACVARHVAHSEAILHNAKTYLLLVERHYGHRGYEHFNAASSHTSGEYLKALRDAILLTDLLATGVVVAHLVREYGMMAAGAVLLGEVLAMLMTWVWLRDGKRQRKVRERRKIR